ncbi:MAG: CDP-archaeol synthase [Zestosphaera sp.]
MYGWLDVLARIVMMYLPAMVANAMPLITRRYIFRNSRPIDFGRTFIDGRRVFGDNKSLEGFASGVVAGSLVGLAYSYYFSAPVWLMYGIVSGLGAMCGDLLNSFVKRRLGLAPGQPFIPLDQISFFLAAFIAVKASRADLLVGRELGVVDFAVGLALAGLLHPLTNYLAYLLGVKESPL